MMARIIMLLLGTEGLVLFLMTTPVTESLTRYETAVVALFVWVLALVIAVLSLTWLVLNRVRVDDSR